MHGRKKTSHYTMQNKKNRFTNIRTQESALNQCTVQTFTESEDTSCCVNTIFPPEDGHGSKHVEGNSITNILLMNKENCALKLVDETILYYDARSKKHQIPSLSFIMKGQGLDD